MAAPSFSTESFKVLSLQHFTQQVPRKLQKCSLATAELNTFLNRLVDILIW